MPSVEAIYENGVLRPLQPLELAEGARLELTIVEISAPDRDNTRVDEATYSAFLEELDRIADLPLESQPVADTATNHDSILYPKQGRVP
jgi:predicted DNA-binding antitoxin AbrB/MazE fold protein